MNPFDWQIKTNTHLKQHEEKCWLMSYIEQRPTHPCPNLHKNQCMLLNYIRIASLLHSFFFYCTQVFSSCQTFAGGASRNRLSVHSLVVFCLEKALLNSCTICREKIIDVRVLRCISVLTGCGHAGVHSPSLKETTSLAHQLHSTATAYWLYCSWRQNKSTRLMGLPEQCAPRSSSFSEKSAFHASVIREAGDKHGASLLVTFAAARRSLMLFSISQAGKDQWKHLMTIKFSHHLIKLAF